MSRFLLALISVVALATSVLASEAKPASELQKDIRVPANTGLAAGFSPDLQAVTLMFDNLYVEVGAAQKGAVETLNQTAVQTKVFTVHVPYSTDQRSLKMTLDIRGFLNTDAGATARLVACVGGKTKVVDLSTDKAKASSLKGKSKAALTTEHANAPWGDFQDRVEVTIQTSAAKPVCQITLFLLVEHNTDTAGAGGALLAVDSLDLAIVKPGKGTHKP